MNTAIRKIICAVFLITVSFAAQGQKQDGFSWTAATPESQGISSDILEKTTNALSEKGTKTFLVIRNDRIVHEWYAPGFSRSQKHYTASMAKALVGGVSLMLVLNDGLLKVDDPASKYVPQWGDEVVRYAGTPIPDRPAESTTRVRSRLVDQR